MEMKAATTSITWLGSQPDRRAVMLSDSQSMLRQIENSMLKREWVALLELSWAKCIIGIYCPDHAGVRENERAGFLAGKAVVEGTVMIRDGDDLIRVVTFKL